MKYSLSNLAASAAIAGTALAASGDFNVLTMNVAGLPAILQGNDVPGDKTVNSKTMGSKFSEYNYDVIHVQEVRASSIRSMRGVEYRVSFLRLTAGTRTSTTMRPYTRPTATPTGPPLPVACLSAVDSTP